MSWYSRYDSFPRSESVGQKRAKAEKLAKKMAAKGEKLEPAVVKGTKLAASFWGQSWNRNLERYQDYDNRLPRGRSYVRNGAVIHLEVEKGLIKALVSGTHLYEVTIAIAPLKPARWKALKETCSGQIVSLIGLLQGKIPSSVMEAVTRENEGLFPEPRDIQFNCSCPDYASLCKHASAAVYGVGARLDERPDLLFLLRGVDHTELIASAGEAVVAHAGGGDDSSSLGDLSAIFGIELEAGAAPPAALPQGLKVKAKPKTEPKAKAKSQTKGQAKAPKKKAAAKKVTKTSAKKSAPSSTKAKKKQVRSRRS